MNSKVKAFFIARREKKEVKEILQTRSKAINELKNLNKKLIQNYWQKEIDMIFYTRKIKQGGKKKHAKEIIQEKRFL